MSEILESNGLKYNRSDDTVLIKIVDTSTDKYIGVNYKKDNDLKIFIFEDVHFTTEDKAFIFMLSKEIFDDYGVTTVIEMLKEECDVLPPLNVSKLKAVIV